MTASTAIAVEAVAAALGLSRHAVLGARLVRPEVDGRSVVRVDLDPGALDGEVASLAVRIVPGDAWHRGMEVLEGIEPSLDRHGALAVPRVLFLDPARHAMGLEWIAAPTLHDALDGPSATECLMNVGAALRALHCAPLAGAAVAIGIEDHFQELMHPHPRELAGCLSRDRGRILRIVEGLRRRECEARWRPANLHRDVHPGQLLVDRGKIWLIDWDLAAAGDPALDLGNLCAYLAHHRPGVAVAARAAIVAGYSAGGGRAVLERVPIFEAFTFLRLACKSYRLRRTGWRREVDRLLGRAEARLLAPVGAAA